MGQELDIPDVIRQGSVTSALGLASRSPFQIWPRLSNPVHAPARRIPLGLGRVPPSETYLRGLPGVSGWGKASDLHCKWPFPPGERAHGMRGLRCFGCPQTQVKPSRGPHAQATWAVFVPALPFLPSIHWSNYSTSGSTCHTKVKIYYVQGLGLCLLLSSVLSSISQNMVWIAPCIRIRGPVSIVSFGAPNCLLNRWELELRTCIVPIPWVILIYPKCCEPVGVKSPSSIFRPPQQMVAVETKIGFFLPQSMWTCFIVGLL